MQKSRGRFLEYLLDRPNVSSAWQRFIEHEFVWGLGTGMLPVERFKQYLVQDYLYLVCRGPCSYCRPLGRLLLTGLDTFCTEQRPSRIQGQVDGLNCCSELALSVSW